MKRCIFYCLAIIASPINSTAQSYIELDSTTYSSRNNCLRFLADVSDDGQLLLKQTYDATWSPSNGGYWEASAGRAWIENSTGLQITIPSVNENLPIVEALKINNSGTFSSANARHAHPSYDSSGLYFWTPTLGAHFFYPYGTQHGGFTSDFSRNNDTILFGKFHPNLGPFGRTLGYKWIQGSTIPIGEIPLAPIGYEVINVIGAGVDSNGGNVWGHYSYYKIGTHPLDTLTSQAVYWDANGKSYTIGPILGFPIPGWPGEYTNYAEYHFSVKRMSPNGKFVVGTYDLPNLYALKIWDIAGGFRDIIPPDNSLIVGGVDYVTNDSHHVTGRYQLWNNSEQVFITSPLSGLQNINTFLAGHGINPSAFGHEILATKWISEDRTRFLGVAKKNSDSCVIWEFNTSPTGPPPTTEGKYGLWNSFLDMRNILELTNNTDYAQEVLVRIFRIDGTIASEHTYNLTPRSQQDVILDTLPGVYKDSYGLINVVGNATGRVTYYRDPAGSFSSFDFAFGIELTEAITGESFVSFNTFQPSFYGPDLENLVANWLSLVNLSPTIGTFQVQKFNLDGETISNESFFVPPYGRLDVDGGHINPGLQKVGLIKITSDIAYTTQLSRYGYGANGGFDFAFPIIAKQTSSNDIHVAVSTRDNAQNWLEVVNTANTGIAATVNYFLPSGDLADSEELFLPPFGQHHLDVNSVYGDEARGHVTVTSPTPSALIANSMFYFRDKKGAILSMYGSQASNPLAQTLTGTYNLFLGMKNGLRLINTSPTVAQVSLGISSYSGPGSNHNYTIPANGSLLLDLTDTSTYATAANTYGSIVASSQQASQIQMEIIRTHVSPATGLLDFVVPTSAH